jgi:hypothetical protein
VTDNAGNVAGSTQKVTLTGTGGSSVPTFLTGYALNNPALRNTYTGYVGMTVTVGSNSLAVSTIGRICVSGNSQTHTVEFVNASTGTPLTGGSASVNMAGCTPGQFVYSPISVTLNAGATYYLVSQETNGGDKWYNDGTVSSTSDGSVAGYVYSANATGPWSPTAAANTAFVPPNFQYTP